jgi:hypothetical protein
LAQNRCCVGYKREEERKGLRQANARKVKRNSRWFHFPFKILNYASEGHHEFCTLVEEVKADKAHCPSVVELPNIGAKLEGTLLLMLFSSMVVGGAFGFLFNLLYNVCKSAS